MQNLIFYYDSESSTRPLGLIFLEGCYCERIVSAPSCLVSTSATSGSQSSKASKEEKLQVSYLLFFLWPFDMSFLSHRITYHNTKEVFVRFFYYILLYCAKWLPKRLCLYHKLSDSTTRHVSFTISRKVNIHHRTLFFFTFLSYFLCQWKILWVFTISYKVLFERECFVALINTSFSLQLDFLYMQSFIKKFFDV